MRLINRVAARVRLSAASKTALLAGLASTVACAMLGEPRASIAAAALTLAGIICLAVQGLEAGRFAYRAVEACAEELGLTPLGAPAAAFRRATQRAGASAPAASSELLAE